MYNSYNQFLFHSFLSALHVSNESSRSSSGTQHNILYYNLVQSVQSCYQAGLVACLLYIFRKNLVVHHQEHGIIYYILSSAPDDERVNSFETCRARKNCGIKIIYKNCASLFSSTHTHTHTHTHKTLYVSKVQHKRRYFLYSGRNHTRSYKQFIHKFVSLNYGEKTTRQWQNIIMESRVVNYLLF